MEEKKKTGDASISTPAVKRRVETVRGCALPSRRLEGGLRPNHRIDLRFENRLVPLEVSLKSDVDFGQVNRTRARLTRLFRTLSIVTQSPDTQSRPTLSNAQRDILNRIPVS